MSKDEPLNSFFDYLGSVSSRDFEDLIFNHRVDLLEEAFVVMDVIPSRSKLTSSVEHRRFIGAWIKVMDDHESAVLMPSRNVTDWRHYSTSGPKWLDMMKLRGLIFFNEESRKMRPTKLFRQLAEPTMTATEL
jgi:hypothetical protein